tara:strand:+ start:134 stop:565 length:432 start_codon:yes stop_codon:yes gene_type:complete
MALSKTETKISEICDDIKELLIFKNRKYGNSALKPCRVFSKSSAVEQLLVRIDDKLNRIMQGAGLLAKDEDVLNDLIGYLVLLKIGMSEEENKETLEIARNIYGDGIKADAEPDLFQGGFKSITIPSTIPDYLKNSQEDENAV